MRSLRRTPGTGPAAPRCAVAILCVATAILAMPETAFGLSFFVTHHDSGTIGEYTTSGATLNASLISGLHRPGGMAVSGSRLFVTNYGIYPGDSSSQGTGTIGEYTTSGATVNASLISGLPGPGTVALDESGSILFVANYDSGTVGAYTTSGATINASLISGLVNPYGIAVSGSTLFVGDCNQGTIGAYTTSGATINASLISLGYGSCPSHLAVSGSTLFVPTGDGTIGAYTTSGATINASLISIAGIPDGIAVFGSNLLITNRDAGTIGLYTTSGATINASLITGLDAPIGIAIVPEPGTVLLVMAGLLGLAAVRMRRA